MGSLNGAAHSHIHKPGYIFTVFILGKVTQVMAQGIALHGGG
ncbi:hypothetical protein [Aeromonas hydrophila]